MFKNEDIFNKIKYALIANNNTRHSTIKLTPFEITNGHLETNESLPLDFEQKIISNYNDSHREKTKLLYDEIHQRISENKNKIIENRNQTQKELPKIPEKIFVKNKQKCQKTKNKYKIT